MFSAAGTLQEKLASQYNKIICLFILVLIITSATTYFTFEKNIQKNLAMFTHYGNSLAQHIARQTSPHILDNDSISIQSVVQQVAQQSPAEIIIVYDISHAILAQVETNLNTEPEALEHFTAFITSGETIIGSVSVSLNKKLQGENLATPFIAIQLLILLLLAFVLLKQHKRKFKQLEHSKEVNESNEHSSQSSSNKESIEPCYIICKIANWNTLFQQLNAESRITHLDRLESNISKVKTLYNGEVLLAIDDYFILEFCSDNEKSILDALYSAQLILNLNKQDEQSIFTLNIIIKKSGKNLPLCQLLEASKKVLSTDKHNNQLFIHQTIAQEYDLSSYAKYEAAIGQSLLKINSLTETCEELLNNQLLQLQRLPTKE